MDGNKGKVHWLDASFVAAAIIASCTGIEADSKLLFVGCGGLCVLDPEPGAVPSAITWETPERDFTNTDGKVLFTGVPVWDGESISNAVWSPDGTVLAVTTVWGLDGQNSILTVQPDGTNAEAIVTHPCCVALLPDEEGWGDPVPRYTKSNLSWSPEGDRLAYVSDIGNIDIYRVDGTRERFFPALPVADRPWFDWGPSGLMYFSDVGKPVYTIHPDGSGLDSLAISGYAFEVSPDGQTLAYTTGHPDHQIYLLNTATRESSYLTDGYGPEWSPDGSYDRLSGENRLAE